MRVLHVVAETPISFLQHLKDITFIEKRPLKYVYHLDSAERACLFATDWLSGDLSEHARNVCRR